MSLDASDPADLVADLVAALQAAVQELEEIRTTPFPEPDWLRGALVERGALLATLKKAPAAVKPRLRKVYTEERALRALSPEPDGLGCFPVSPDVLAQIDELLEVVRRRALTDPFFDRALRAGRV